MGGLFVFGIEVAFVPGESCLFGSLLGFLSRSRYKFLKKDGVFVVLKSIENQCGLTFSPPSVCKKIYDSAKKRRFFTRGTLPKSV